MKRRSGLWGNEKLAEWFDGKCVIWIIGDLRLALEGVLQPCCIAMWFPGGNVNVSSWTSARKSSWLGKNFAISRPVDERAGGSSGEHS